MNKSKKILFSLLVSLILLFGAGMCVYASSADSTTVASELDSSDSEQNDENTNNGETDDTSAVPVEMKLVTSVTKHNVALSWDAVSEATEYHIFNGNTEIAITSDLSYVLANQKCGTYTYAVKAYAVDASDAEANPVLKGESSAESVVVKVELSAPKLSSATFKTASSAEVKWSAVSNADGYYIYRKAGNGSWVKLNKDAPVTGTSYIDKSVKLGTDYTYTVRAYDSVCGTESSYNTSGIKASYLGTTKVTGVTAPSKAGVKAAWNAVSGATGYKVYAKIGDGKWKQITKTTSTSYTYKLSSKYWGKKISIKVYPYNASYTALESNTKSVTFKPATVTLKKATAKSYKSNKVTWKKVSGAAGYKVYRKTENGSYKRIKTISDGDTTSYTDATAAIGTTYYYTVKAYWKTDDTTQNGSCDKAGLKVKTAVSAPKLVSVKSSGNAKKATVTWKKVSGATGYRVYRKTGSGKWEKIATVKSGSTVTYTDKSVKWNKKYTYTVKAYRKEDGKNYWSTYDKTGKSIKIEFTPYPNGADVDPSQPMVALTFDDGPGPYTQAIVDCLEKYDSRATFFVVGNRVNSYKSALKAAYDAGCEIGNHTYSHPTLTKLSVAAIKSQVSKTDSAVKKITGEAPTIIRAPGGATNSTVRSVVDKPFIYWSIDTLDWKTRSKSKTINSVLKNVDDGDIILMHDIHSPTKDAALYLIPELVERGYQLVTVSELAYYKGVDMQDGVTYYSFH